MSWVISLMMLALFALSAGAIALWRRGGSRKQVILMVVMVIVIALNIAILTVPAGTSTSPFSDQFTDQPK